MAIFTNKNWYLYTIDINDLFWRIALCRVRVRVEAYIREKRQSLLVWQLPGLPGLLCQACMSLFDRSVSVYCLLLFICCYVCYVFSG